MGNNHIVWSFCMGEKNIFKFKFDIKKILSFTCLVFLFAFTVIFFGGCKKHDDSKKKLVASCYPVYIMVSNIADGIDDVEVLNMSESHKGCLHNFQLQSEDLKKIERSSAFIINGAGMESFLGKVVNELPSVKIVDSSKEIDLIKDEDCDHDHEEDCEHEYNPHIWLSIDNSIKQVQNISKGLAEIDPTNAEKYQENADKYIKKLNDLKSEMKAGLGGIKGKNIITFHEAFPYFAKEFGLNIVDVITSEPGSEPSAKEISEIMEKVKEYNISALFTEPQYSDSSAKIISAETGAKIYTLDPIVTGNSSKDDYINKMRENMAVLKEALK